MHSGLEVFFKFNSLIQAYKSKWIRHLWLNKYKNNLVFIFTIKSFWLVLTPHTAHEDALLRPCSLTGGQFFNSRRGNTFSCSNLSSASIFLSLYTQGARLSSAGLSWKLLISISWHQLCTSVTARTKQEAYSAGNYVFSKAIQHTEITSLQDR